MAMHRTKLLELLTEHRVSDLNIKSRAKVLDAMQQIALTAHKHGEKFVSNIFTHTKFGDLTRLKMLMDSKGDYQSLHKMVFSDIKERDIRSEVLDHINREAKAIQGVLKMGGHKGKRFSRRPWRKILSDVDDTLLSSGGKYPAGIDKRLPRKALYPGILDLYKELDLGATGVSDWEEEENPRYIQRGEEFLQRDLANLVFLSARPHVYRDLAEAHTYEKFLHLVDEGKLYGVPTMLAGDLASGISYMTTDNFEYLAEKKFQNFMEYAQLYPEFSHVFVGDNGQGDVRAAELVMTAKRRGSAVGLPGSDEEVLGMLSSDVVPDLTVTYIHVVQPLEKTFGWDKDARSRWRDLNIIFVDNYVDAAIHAALVMKPPLIHAHGLRRIMVKSIEDYHAIKEWHKVKDPKLMKEQLRLMLNQSITVANEKLSDMPLDQWTGGDKHVDAFESVRTIDATCEYQNGTHVSTNMGPGFVIDFRPSDGVYTVELEWELMKGKKVVAYLQYNQLAPYADKSKAVADSLIKFYAGIKEAIPQTKANRSKTVGDAMEGGVELLPAIGAKVKTPYGNGILLEIRVSAGRADDPDDELNDKNEAGAEAEAEAAGGGGGGTVAGEGEAMVDGGAGRAELERESYEVETFEIDYIGAGAAGDDSEDDEVVAVTHGTTERSVEERSVEDEGGGRGDEATDGTVGGATPHGAGDDDVQLSGSHASNGSHATDDHDASGISMVDDAADAGAGAVEGGILKTSNRSQHATDSKSSGDSDGKGDGKDRDKDGGAGGTDDRNDRTATSPTQVGQVGFRSAVSNALSPLRDAALSLSAPSSPPQAVKQSKAITTILVVELDWLMAGGKNAKAFLRPSDVFDLSLPSTVVPPPKFPGKKQRRSSMPNLGPGSNAFHLTSKLRFLIPSFSATKRTPEELKAEAEAELAAAEARAAALHFAAGAAVVTMFGNGRVVKRRESDGMYEVQLEEWALATVVGGAGDSDGGANGDRSGVLAAGSRKRQRRNTGRKLAVGYFREDSLKPRFVAGVGDFVLTTLGPGVVHDVRRRTGIHVIELQPTMSATHTVYGVALRNIGAGTNGNPNGYSNGYSNGNKTTSDNEPTNASSGSAAALTTPHSKRSLSASPGASQPGVHSGIRAPPTGLPSPGTALATTPFANPVDLTLTPTVPSLGDNAGGDGGAPGSVGGLTLTPSVSSDLIASPDLSTTPPLAFSMLASGAAALGPLEPSSAPLDLDGASTAAFEHPGGRLGSSTDPLNTAHANMERESGSGSYRLSSDLGGRPSSSNGGSIPSSAPTAAPTAVPPVAGGGLSRVESLESVETIDTMPSRSDSLSSLRGRASSFDSPDKASTVAGSTEISRRDRSVSDADVVPTSNTVSSAGGAVGMGMGLGMGGSATVSDHGTGKDLGGTVMKLRTKSGSAPGGSSVWSNLISPAKAKTPPTSAVAPAGAGGPDRANGEVKIRPRRSTPSSCLLYAQPDVIIRRVVALPGSKVKTKLGLMGVVRKVRRDGFYEVELEWRLSGGQPAILFLMEGGFALDIVEGSEQPEGSRLLGALALFNPLNLLRTASPMRPVPAQPNGNSSEGGAGSGRGMERQDSAPLYMADEFR
mmetsp:Transcript_100743/g.288844  ORF Transcript_100743/g.288844 Transcript_100743/m.288844 type:complete len:1599 (-) Transcript_100743:375-5171(-)